MFTALPQGKLRNNFVNFEPLWLKTLTHSIVERKWLNSRQPAEVIIV